MFFLSFALASLWTSAVVHCFETLGSAGVLGFGSLVSSFLIQFSAEMYAGSLAGGC